MPTSSSTPSVIRCFLKKTRKVLFPSPLVLLFAAYLFLHAFTGYGQEINRSDSTIAQKSPALQNFSQKQIFEAWGWFTAQETEVTHAELSDAELAAFQKGMIASAKGEPPHFDLQKISPDIDRLSAARRDKHLRTLEEGNLESGRRYLEVIRKRPGINTTTDGLCYELIRPGAGLFPQPEQTVTVHYVGRLIDGTDFTEIGPYDIVLVKNRLIPALFEGIQKIKKGGVIRLYVPPTTLAGNETRPGVPKGATTVYELEVLDVKPTQADDLANSLLPPAPELPPPPLSGATAEQVIEAWGWVTARKAGAADLGFSDAELTDYAHGFAAAIRGEAGSFDEEKIRPMVRKLAGERRAQARLAIRQKRTADMNTLFAKLDKNPRIVALPDGLRYETLKIGTGPKPKPGQIVVVDYTARLMDGTVFDQTYNEPLHVEVGSVIAGWNEGIQKINKGGRIKLYIPPSIGYGDEDVSGVVSRIPASSLLIYEIELLDIQEQSG